MIPVRENSEVVIIYPDICIDIYSISKLIKIHNVNPQFMIFPTGDMMIQLQSTSNLYGFFCGVMSTPD